LETDDRSQFSSGDIELDRFFVRYAGQNQFRHHLGTSYVAVDASQTIVGYNTVTVSELSPALIAGAATRKLRLPTYPVPVLRLARLAVDGRARKLGVGAQLMRSVFAIAVQLANDAGCVGVVVDAKSQAVAYYRRLGFMELAVVSGELGARPVPCMMFLEIGQLLA
jgi:predicted N-acetyltransferase YhbS